VASVGERIIEVIAEKMGAPKDQIKPETHLEHDLNADSLDKAELVMEFEEEFDVSIPEEEAEKLRTVGDIIKYAEEHSK